MALRLKLRPGERAYINGALLEVDRTVEISLISHANFLLGRHVMPEQEATTPLRRLYFSVQQMIIEPATTSLDWHRLQAPLLAAFRHDRAVMTDLAEVSALIAEERLFLALKRIRDLLAAVEYRRQEETV